jgi:hypothetical protein
MDTLYGTDQELHIVHHQSSVGFIVVNDQQHYNIINNAIVDAHQQTQLYEYFCYDGTVTDEATNHDVLLYEYFYYDLWRS